MTKTKKDIVREVANATGFTQNETTVLVDEVLKVIAINLSENNRIELRRFGVFYTKRRKPKTVRSPKTGKVINLPERVVTGFKPSKLLRK
ncbi:MAG: HU family DNA-binding protein [Candidatus Stahlbacteria bacterium]|nr:HU family DNA-binding protein [Candidatus Stahlbacteria bacterium]